MKEILFRGKRINNGEWVEGNLFIPDKPDTPTQICIGTNIIRITYDVIPETVGQYTGLTDRNGEKIFEGDILIIVARKVDNAPSVLLIVTDIRKICEAFKHGAKYWKVIGNIHDNPELLKGGAE